MAKQQLPDKVAELIVSVFLFITPAVVLISLAFHLSLFQTGALAMAIILISMGIDNG